VRWSFNHYLNVADPSFADETPRGERELVAA
jgi:hypothetical protein